MYYIIMIIQLRYSMSGIIIKRTFWFILQKEIICCGVCCKKILKVLDIAYILIKITSSVLPLYSNILHWTKIIT